MYGSFVFWKWYIRNNLVYFKYMLSEKPCEIFIIYKNNDFYHSIYHMNAEEWRVKVTSLPTKIQLDASHCM